MQEHIESKSYVSTRTALGHAIVTVMDDPRTMIVPRGEGKRVWAALRGTDRIDTERVSTRIMQEL